MEDETLNQYLIIEITNGKNIYWFKNKKLNK